MLQLLHTTQLFYTILKNTVNFFVHCTYLYKRMNRYKHNCIFRSDVGLKSELNIKVRVFLPCDMLRLNPNREQGYIFTKFLFLRLYHYYCMHKYIHHVQIRWDPNIHRKNLIIFQYQAILWFYLTNFSKLFGDIVIFVFPNIFGGYFS